MTQEVKLPQDVVKQIASFFHGDFSTTSTLHQDNTLITTIQRVAAAANIKLKSLDHLDEVSIAEIARVGGFRFRRVELKPNWWHQDNGPLLGFFKDSKEPCALIPKRGGYMLWDPKTREGRKVTDSMAASIILEAFYLYRTYPDEALNVRSLFHFAVQGLRWEIFKILLLQLGIGLLALLTPIATKNLFAQVIPDSDTLRLWQWLYALVVVAVVVTTLSLSQALIMMRLRFRLNSSMQAAIWDRIIRLPAAFFRRFASGDLATRTDLIDAIQQLVTNAVLGNVINIIFMFLPLVLMAYYSIKMTLVVVLLTLVLVAFYCFTMRLQLGYQRENLRLRGILSSWVLQFINSINKIRTTNSEEKVFNIWLDKWFLSLKNFYKASLTSVVVDTFAAGFSALMILVIYAMVAYSKNISFGDFIGFNAAYGLFSFAVFSFVNMVLTLTMAITLYERAEPILQAIPESTNNGIRPKDLQGHIQIRNLSFQYQEKHMVLKDISMDIAPGSFTAIVGLSGGGKSTLVRLLLGFEKPVSGHILYDNIDITKYDIFALRRKLGVVLQNDLLVPGTIYENICASTQLPLDIAWQAASIVGMEEEIQAMPMKMNTLIVEGGRTLSSGQRQRLIIARALAYNPQICIFDEATSHIDNITQALIHKNLSLLQITRVVIAQRLNTIADADYIYVIDDGRLVQQGKFQELMQQPGLFAQLADKQGCTINKDKKK